MGNQSSSQYFNQTVKSFKNYEQVQKIEQGVLYRKKHQNQQTNQQYYEYFLLKQHNYHNQPAFLQAFNRYQSQIAANKQNQDVQSNTLCIKEVVKEQYQHFCSNTYKIYALYEYPELTLRDQILVRAKQSKYFQQCQLVAILQTCVAALQQIRAIISFNTKSIFISQDGVIKVLHNDLVEQNYRHLITQNIYYAPQKLSNFNYESSSQISIKKQIIFSMGMTLLQTCCLQDLTCLYDYSYKKLNQRQLENKISSICHRYSTDLVELLSNMLQTNPNRRVSILEIQRSLNRYDQNEHIQTNTGLNFNQYQVLNGQEKNQNQFSQKRCDQLFYTGEQLPENEQLAKIKQTEEYSDQPSVPNLISNQNSSRRSLTKHQNFILRPQQNYSKIPQDQFIYKATPVIHPPMNDKNQTANFSTNNLTIYPPTNLPSSRNNQNLFTDPKLLQMIRKDLEEIKKSRVSKGPYDCISDSRMNSNAQYQANTHRNSFQNQPYSLVNQYKINKYEQKSSMNNSKNYYNVPSEYVSLKNCPQIQSLAASVAYENNQNTGSKNYVYEQSQIKNYQNAQQDTEQGPSPHKLFQIKNQSQKNFNPKASIVLSTKSFNINKNQNYHQASPIANNDMKTIRLPLKQMPSNINVQNKSFSQIQEQIKKDMMRKKQANLVYLEQTYQDGVKYEGMSKNGLKQGYGKLIYSDGAYYEGYFHQDKINGKGTLFYYKDKPAYDGQWIDQQFDGYGQLYNQQPEGLQQEFPYHNFNFLQNYWIKYEGQFKQDNKHGHGKIFLTTNQYVEAQFKDDMLNGWGKFYKKNGNILEGRWQNNVLVELAN